MWGLILQLLSSQWLIRRRNNHNLQITDTALPKFCQFQMYNWDKCLGRKGPGASSHSSFLPILVPRFFSGTQQRLPPTAPSKVHITQPLLNKRLHLHLNNKLLMVVLYLWRSRMERNPCKLPITIYSPVTHISDTSSFRVSEPRYFPLTEYRCNAFLSWIDQK